jgi:hypothetical protein
MPMSINGSPRSICKLNCPFFFVKFLPINLLNITIRNNQPHTKNNPIKTPEENLHVPVVCLQSCWIVCTVLIVYVNIVKMVSIIWLNRWAWELKTLPFPFSRRNTTLPSVLPLTLCVWRKATYFLSFHTVHWSQYFSMQLS